MIHMIKSTKNESPIFVDEDGSLILLPTFFCRSLRLNGLVWIQNKEADASGFIRTNFVSRDISDTTANFVVYRLKQFLNWLEEYGAEIMPNALDMHPMLDQSWLSYYLEKVLIEKESVGEHSINQHLLTLRYYYNYLANAGLSNFKEININRQARVSSKQNTMRRSAVKYLSEELRHLLYVNTSCVRDELVLRGGAELGLRSKENLGLLVNDFDAGKKRYYGFRSLFKKMHASPEQQTFRYWLQGKFVKQSRHSGGLGRWLLISRSLLRRYEKYYREERPKSSHDSLLLNHHGKNEGTPISHNHGTTVFRKARQKVISLQTSGVLNDRGQAISVEHTYHVLRHSFGTDLFYSEAGGIENVDAITTTHPVFLEVAKRMGHSVCGKYAANATVTYIRSCHIKYHIENGFEL